MKILQLSTSDIEGGAARAAYRLHKGLRAIDIDSQVLVRAKLSHDPNVIAEPSLLTKLGPTLNSVPLRTYRKRERKMFSPQWFPDHLASSVARLSPDIVNMHWVCNGYLQIETLKKLPYPLVWTLQDMWAFTGGCHYSESCDRYQKKCGSCPQLNSTKENDLSRQVWNRKFRAWKNANLTIVVPSSWMAECARSSSLFGQLRIETIPFCLDTDVYRPHNRQFARTVLNLPQDKQLILFGALAATSDKRKGFEVLASALRHLHCNQLLPNAELAVFGSDPPEKPVDLGFKAHYLGHLNDDVSLALAYSTADVMIVPSFQESFGQTASEALACGVPVVAFNATGLKDIVAHQQSGYLAEPYEAEDLAKGIVWVLADTERHTQLCRAARQRAEQEFSLSLQAYRYVSLFQDLLGGSR